jgi:hypothetical protein
MMQIDHEKGKKKKKRDFCQRSLEIANSQLQYRHSENKAGAEKIASNKRRRETTRIPETNTRDPRTICPVRPNRNSSAIALA